MTGQHLGMARRLPSVARGTRVGVAVSVVALLVMPLSVLNPPDVLAIPGAYDGGDLDDLTLANVGTGLTAPRVDTFACLRLDPSDRPFAGFDRGQAARQGLPSVGLRAPPHL